MIQVSARFVVRLRSTQTPVIIPLALICVGMVALVLGDGASKAFANLGGAVMLRIMGGLLLTGGVLTVISIMRSSALREVLGLTIIVFGASIYVVGAILGLGTQGLVSGIGYAGITLTLLSRIFDVVHSARVADPTDRTSV